MGTNNKKLWNFGFSSRGYKDLSPVNCGYEVCEPFHTGTGYRNYHMIHYIEGGSGTLYSESGTFKVSKGQIFIVKADEAARYVADALDPWTYVWIGFDGALADMLYDLPSPIAETPYTAFSMIRALEDRTDTREEMAAAALFMIFAYLFSGKASHPNYVRRAVDTVNSLYMTPLSVAGIADTLGLDRRYLSRIFKAEMGVSIQEYIINVRMEQAKRLLFDGYNVKDTSELVGYQDQFNFSKMFKKHFGCSPREYTKKNIRERS